MTSSVLLVPSHDSFYAGNFFVLKDKKNIPDNAIELTEEMLSWLRCGYNGEFLDESWTNAYRNALEALLNIPPFDAQVSMWVDVEKKHICFASGREWGIIYLGDQTVVCFSHDTRHKNRSFYGLLHWTEQVDDNESLENVKKWSVDQWRTFFYSRIRRSAEGNLRSAQKKIVKASKEITKANKQKEDFEKVIAVIPV